MSATPVHDTPPDPSAVSAPPDPSAPFPSAPPLRLPALGMPDSIDTTERTLAVTLTTRERDRQGDIVEPAGLDFASFMQNPVVLWAHDLTRPPVAKVESVEVQADRVVARIRFADTDFAREVFDLYAGGYLHAWSLGFVPTRWKRIIDDNGEHGFHVLEAEVVEVSAVPVPANREALTHALKSVRSPALKTALADTAPAASESPSRPGITLTTDQLATLANSLAGAMTTRTVKALHANLTGALV